MKDWGLLMLGVTAAGAYALAMAPRVQARRMRLITRAVGVVAVAPLVGFILFLIFLWAAGALPG